MPGLGKEQGSGKEEESSVCGGHEIKVCCSTPSFASFSPSLLFLPPPSFLSLDDEFSSEKVGEKLFQCRRKKRNRQRKKEREEGKKHTPATNFSIHHRHLSPFFSNPLFFLFETHVKLQPCIRQSQNFAVFSISYFLPSFRRCIFYSKQLCCFIVLKKLKAS